MNKLSMQGVCLLPPEAQQMARDYLGRITELVQACSTANDTLFGGELAAAFYFYYLNEFTGDETYAEEAIDRMEKVLGRFEAGSARIVGPYYCAGAGGLLYLLALFAEKGYLSREMIADIRYLAADLGRYAAAGMEQQRNDFVHGAFGLLHSLTAYARSSNDARPLKRLLQHAVKHSLHTADPWIVSAIGSDAEKDIVGLGLAHGQSGLLITLMNACEQAGSSSALRSQIRRNVDYLLCFRRCAPPEGCTNIFPAAFVPGGGLVENGRLAWCYGDLGPILLLLRAADFFGSPDYRTAAEELCRITSLRTTFEDTLSAGAQVCHGAGGLACIYQLLWQKTGQQECRDAARFWAGEMLKHLEAEITGCTTPARQMDMIEGLPGMGLVLMSLLQPEISSWGRLILLN